MIDLEKLNEFLSTLTNLSLKICEHAQTDLKGKCDGNCPYRRLCDLLCLAKSRIVIMKYNPDNPNKTEIY